IGNQVADITRTQGKIAEEKALKDPKAIQAAKDALAENGNLTPTNKQLVEQIRNTQRQPVTVPAAIYNGRSRPRQRSLRG
ncbi:hypothetical protein AB3M88_004124, partial [Yersinia enterocolitica]